MEFIPGTPAELLNAFRTRNATSPRLSWYGPDSERVELSGRVLENWVAKTANYLVDELDAEPGTTIQLDLPLHWRSLVWLLAAWATGTTAITDDGDTSGSPAGTIAGAGASADIIATATPAQLWQELAGQAQQSQSLAPQKSKPGALVVAVALPALAMRWMGELPAHTLDYSGDVRSHADVFFADDTPNPGDIAWRHGATATSYGELFALAESELPEAPQRVLLQTRDGWDAVVRVAVRTWATGGSVVLLGEGVEATERLRSSENITPT